ncbi:glycosyltransferase family 2 protein [Trichocoleus desertorum AS-A10]|uniref:glycosyltransferase family 2 protein n=1 Tax=Trichocoleus desertorum TaxID=1481672 RepID=UPI0032993647
MITDQSNQKSGHSCSYIIIPVYNRKATTLKCLETLDSSGDLKRCSVVVVDDASTDGTSEAIRARFPEVTVLLTKGHLWWTGAIKKGMEYAYSEGAAHFIWLNDDTLPSQEAIKLLLTAALHPNSKKLVSAQCYQNSDFATPTYGGRRRKRFALQFLLARRGETIEADVLSGNLVCLPRSVVDDIGYPPSEQAPQTWADVVYTWKAKQSGYRIEVLGEAIAVCPENELEEGWASSSIPMMKRWAMLNTPKSSIYPPAYWLYCKSLYGPLGFVPFVRVYVNLIVFTILRFFLPLKLLKALKKFKNSYIS